MTQAPEPPRDPYARPQSQPGHGSGSGYGQPPGPPPGYAEARPPAHAPGGGYAGRERAPRNGLGLAALILGIVGAVFGLLPLTFWLAAILGVLAIAFGIVGRSRARRREATNPKQALWGVILGAVALVLAVLGAVLLFALLSQFGGDLDEIGTNLEEYARCLEDAGSDQAAIDVCDERFGE